jgi:hypothetical protein
MPPCCRLLRPRASGFFSAMLTRECRSGTEKAGLRVGDQFDRDLQ